MDEIALLRHAGAEFERRLAAITPDQLLQPTPCEEWTVRDLVSHVVGESIMSVRLLHGADAESAMVGLDGDILGDDASTAFATAASAEHAAFEEPGATERIVHHPAMDMPGAQLLGFRIGGLTLHAWDLARASGGDETLDSELVEAVWAQLSPMAPFITQTGVFGPGPSGEVGSGCPTAGAPSGPLGPPSLTQESGKGRSHAEPTQVRGAAKAVFVLIFRVKARGPSSRLQAHGSRQGRHDGIPYAMTGKRDKRMARYIGDDNGRRIEVVTHWTTKCELLVDGKQVDSGAMPLLGGTLKLVDTVNGTMLNVTSGNGLRPKVVLLAGGEEHPLSREKV